MDINNFPMYFKDNFGEFVSRPVSEIVAYMRPKDRIVLNNPGAHKDLILGLLFLYNIQHVRFYEIQPDELMELPFSPKTYAAYYDHDPTTINPHSGLVTRWGPVRC